MATEKRLINAYALMDCIRDSKRHNPHDDPTVAQNHMFEHDHFMKMVSLAPTVDAVEVVHGRWEECDWVEFDGHGECMHYPKAARSCSNCHNAFKKELLWKDNYCPNCGAKMDGGADNGI